MKPAVTLGVSYSYDSGAALLVDGELVAAINEERLNRIKVCASNGVMSHTGPAGAQQYSNDELRAICDEAHRAGRKVAAHTMGDFAASEYVMRSPMMRAVFVGSPNAARPVTLPSCRVGMKPSSAVTYA